MFPTKTSRDVGMVSGVTVATGSCMENQLVENVQEQAIQIKKATPNMNLDSGLLLPMVWNTILKPPPPTPLGSILFS